MFYLFCYAASLQKMPSPQPELLPVSVYCRWNKWCQRHWWVVSARLDHRGSGRMFKGQLKCLNKHFH